ncbi:hypothetical protein [Streptomyces sp. NPDC005283]|uniref:hypothetical protein n=1 Tax=Streptomyces sp. NPDC005283 TaxID=3156871 RepID=UPI0034515ACD
MASQAGPSSSGWKTTKVLPACVLGRVVDVDAGQLIEQGPAQQVLTAPRHRFTASLVAGSARLAADLRP